jgi:hypothetical protein
VLSTANRRYSEANLLSVQLQIVDNQMRPAVPTCRLRIRPHHVCRQPSHRVRLHVVDSFFVRLGVTRACVRAADPQDHAVLLVRVRLGGGEDDQRTGRVLSRRSRKFLTGHPTGCLRAPPSGPPARHPRCWRRRRRPHPGQRSGTGTTSERFFASKIASIEQKVVFGLRCVTNSNRVMVSDNVAVGMAPKRHAKRTPSPDRGSKVGPKRPPRAEGAAPVDVSATNASVQAGAEQLDFEHEIQSLLEPLAAHLKTQGVDHTKLLKKYPHREQSKREVLRTLAHNLRSTNPDYVQLACHGLSSMFGNNVLASRSFVDEATKLNLEWAAKNTQAPLLQAAKEAKDALGLQKVETLVVTTKEFARVFNGRSVPVDIEAYEDINALGEHLFARKGSSKKGFPIVALYGESGSGKTECVLRLASATKVTGRKKTVVVACMVFAPSLLDGEFELANGPADEPQCRVDRAARVKNAIKAELDLTGVPWRQQCEWKKRQTTTEKLTLVVFIDEAGTRPLFVRALCDAVFSHGLESTLCADLGVHSARFVVAGTGCDGANISPGSLPASYVTMQPRAQLAWKALSQNPEIAKWKSRLKGTSVTAAVTRELVANARFAALLARQLRELTYPETGEWRWLLQQQLSFAATEFKGLNGLEKLPLGEYTYVVLLAFLLSRNCNKLQDDFRNTFKGHALHKALSCVLVDRAEQSATSASNAGATPPSPAELTFPDSGRYELGRHHLLMQRLIVDGLAFHDASWSAFEMLTSEGMLQVVRMMSEPLRPHALKIDPNVESGKDWPCKTPQVAQHWVGEIAMIKWMAERVQDACSDDTVVQPGPVRRSFASTRVDVDTSLQQFLKLFPAQGEERRRCHHVVLNGDKASGPDVMVGVQLSNRKFVFFFVQCKNYVGGTELRESVIAKETAKIGFPTKLGAAKEALDPKAPRQSLALPTNITAAGLKVRFPQRGGNRPSWFNTALNFLQGGLPNQRDLKTLEQAHIALSDHPPAPPLIKRLLDDGHQVYGVLLLRSRATKPGTALDAGIGHPKMLYVASPDDGKPTKQWFLDRGEPHLATSFMDACAL